ncbi:hypothetical protein FHR24_000487 [Wenyingzhuangia heitensis]|uniref:Uracil phosphoribosyltransferase n=1 Tax=Wenyingzhuangia heitensis TaxID=1487859 RepID=A0ABX0U5K5_9FLAO|nr:hypothetical protein [Wenyingzhuangia heitensis]NIJ44048.1 hypothetical protein [Wenyingzhuangia heitensis]
MTALNIFNTIDDLFTNGLFAPFKALRFSGSWWGSNALNFVFIIIGLVYFAYWMKESKRFKDTNTEDSSK